MQRILLFAILSATAVAMAAITLDYTGSVKMACSQDGCEVMIQQRKGADASL